MMNLIIHIIIVTLILMVKRRKRIMKVIMKIIIKTKLKKDFFGSKSSNQLFNDSDNIGYIFNTKIKVPNLKRFHCQLMKQNEEKQKKKVTDIFKIIYNKPKQEENKIEIVDKEFTGKQSLNEYLKLIREDMKFNKAYHKKSLKDDVKILLKNESKSKTLYM